MVEPTAHDSLGECSSHSGLIPIIREFLGEFFGGSNPLKFLHCWFEPPLPLYITILAEWKYGKLNISTLTGNNNNNNSNNSDV